MRDDRIARLRFVVAHWGDAVFDEARELEGSLAAAAADALVDALLDIESMTEALAESSLSEAEEELRAIHTMEGEVMNGGFVQFFDNCGLSEVELAAQGCARIGAAHFEPIVRKALELVDDVPDEDWPPSLVKALDDVDNDFYDAYLEVEELLKLRLAYAADHPEEFRALRD